MSFKFVQKNTNLNAFFKKSFSRKKSTQDEKVRFIKGYELKLTQVELIHSFSLRV